MISIDLYFQFLPHWAGPMIKNNLDKASKFFHFNIKNYYIYPHFVRVDTDLEEKNSYVHTIVEKPLPSNNPEFIDNLKKKIKDHHQLIIENNNYKIIAQYDNIKNFIGEIVDYSLKIDTSYPKNIFWSNVGNYITPRPFTGYGYGISGPTQVIEGHLFPIEKYFDFNWNNLMTYEKKLEHFNHLTKDFNHLINPQEAFTIIHTLYHPYPLILDFNGHNLPEDIIISCLKNHNNGYYFNKKAIVFMDYKANKNLEIIKKGYQDTINIRMEETAYYYHQDENKTMDYWNESLKNIMVFEDKIHMGHKKVTVQKILSYLLNLQSIPYTNEQLNEVTNYLLDLNTKIVQEFNELQGFMASQLMVTDNFIKNIIYKYYKGQYDDPWVVGLKIANNIYDSMIILGLGGIMTPHKDPYNLKGVIDDWLKLLINNKLTINIQDIIKIFEEDYNEKFFWKNTINAINSRWILMVKLPPYINDEIFGYDVSQEVHYYSQILAMNGLKKRLTGLLKKNGDEENSMEINEKDYQLEKLINELYQYDSYEKSYYWLQNNEKFLMDYLDHQRIKANNFRESLIEKIIQWKYYE